jgi:leader peptidase (prepilin peptidase)/N-methyltransferase
VTGLGPGAGAAALLGVLGLVVGSFDNVVVFRAPEGRSVVRPPSACPKCGARVRAYDNVPVVSWVVLRGRCRDCRAPISPRYPAVELFVGAVFMGIGWRYGLTWTGAGEALLAAGLVALGVIDFDHMLLPRKVVYYDLAAVAAVLVAGAAAEGQWRRLGVAVASGFVPWALFFALNYFAPQALGFGDVRLAFLMGFGLGWLGAAYAFLGFLVASLLGALVGTALMAVGKAGRRTPVPFGTFLAVGALLTLLAGAPIVHWYQGNLAGLG